MQSPVVYIVLSMLFASITLSTVFFLAWRTLGHKDHALSWALGFLAATAQWTCNFLGSSFPSLEAYWVTVSALSLCLITLGLRGHCQRTNCRFLPQNLWPFSGAVLALVAWVTAIDPHVGLRIALVPAAGAIVLFLSAFLVIRGRRRPRPAEWAAAVSMILFGVCQGVGAVMGLMQGAEGDPGYQALYLQFNFLSLPAGYIATGMFVIFMLASDISEEMKELAVRDQLTGVYDRRGLGEQGAMVFASARRSGRPVSIIMSDIDRFKFINDEYGHAIGDSALCHFADILRGARRADDVLARVGGEEFALVLPGTELKAAISIADELCRRVAATPMRVNNKLLTMTASFGVAAVNDSDGSLQDTIIRADRALYRSKRAGRNQIDLESSQMMLAADGTLQPISA